ncbi:MAG: ATP-binding protein [Candidatus Omnitrophica bacterium]|nr:ATP-binding protein [Candidatus Omnitrophota bacterium]
MIKRQAEHKLKTLAKGFPIVALIGPRQSGKTTLARKAFPDKPYTLLEDPDTLSFARKDARSFLSQFPNGAIIDEAQNAPQLFSYLLGIVDNKNIPGMFVLTGSQNFLLMEKISQSLSGRIALLKLLPFSYSELLDAGIAYDEYEQYLLKGMYPRIYHANILPRDFYSAYVQTYLERDVRNLKNIHNLSDFHTFLKMCAYRSGQLVNLSSLANDCGITHNTAKAWISILETSFIIFMLKPHHNNFNKRLIKMPKLYFSDPGLAAYLADIYDLSHMSNHPLKGGLFEGFIISDLLKGRFNLGEENNLYFWRDKTGHEIDCLIEEGMNLKAVEFKSGRTITDDYFKNIEYWNRISKNKYKKSFIIYGGRQEQRRAIGHVIPWKKMGNLE